MENCFLSLLVGFAIKTNFLKPVLAFVNKCEIGKIIPPLPRVGVGLNFGKTGSFLKYLVTS